MFQARVETSRKDVFFILLYLILWGNLENKKVKKKNYAIYFMFSFELELYAIQCLVDIFGSNTNHSLSKHLVRKSSYFIIDVNEIFKVARYSQSITCRILHYM